MVSKETAALQKDWIGTCEQLALLISSLSSIHGTKGVAALEDPGVAHLLTAFEGEPKVHQYMRVIIGIIQDVPREDADNEKLERKERELRFRQKCRRLAAKCVDHWRDGALKKMVLDVPAPIARMWANRIENPAGIGQTTETAAIADGGADKRPALGGPHGR